jgi:protein-disulfide isomerase
MASRTKQKEEARARRMAEEQARAEKARRDRRVRMLGGVVLIAAVIVAVAIAVSSGGGGNKTVNPTSSTAKQAATSVNGLLAGIPQSGMTLGSPSAKVTLTEYGDLQCPVCQSLALGAQTQLIQNEVRSGKAKLVFRSLETASSGSPIANAFQNQQVAAGAAGLQNRAWDYIELFYHQQGQEGTAYATESYLDNLARQIAGLNYSKWLADRKNPSLLTQLQSDQQAASAGGYNSTPTVIVSGPKGSSQPIVGPQSYSAYQQAISSVGG